MSSLQLICFALAIFAPFVTAGTADNESALPIWVQLSIAFCLVCFSAMFAGMTLGIMGLDTLSLEIIASAGSEPDRTYASDLLPVRKMGHVALCTLILGNMWANVMIAELCADVNPEDGEGSGGIAGIVGFLLSTFIILIFTEILPMSICKSANALKIASSGVPVLKVFIVLLYPIAKPLGWLLDRIIQHDPGQIYDREELKKLMVMHCETHGDRSGLEKTELRMLLGAMSFHESLTGDIMEPLERVFMVEESTPINDSLLQQLWMKGYSRVPVYCKDRQRITGILYVKNLMLFKETRMQQTVGAYILAQNRPVCTVSDQVKLPQLLKQFQTGRAHLVIVQKVANVSSSSFELTSPKTIYEAVGVVTLEDIIVKLIGSDILDEYDDERSRIKLPRVNFYSYALTPDAKVLSQDELVVLSHYFRQSVEVFAFWTNDQIVSLLRGVGTKELRPSSSVGTPQSSSQKLSRGQWPSTSSCVVDELGGNTIYMEGVSTDTFTFVLCGVIEIFVSSEQFRSERRAMTWLAESALLESYAPNFTAIIRQPTRAIQITRSDYERHARIQTAAEQLPSPFGGQRTEERRNEEVAEELTEGGVTLGESSL